MNNLTPNYKTLTRIPLFRRAVLQSFPFIEEDFDALTDYELLSKVVEYLNKVVEQQNLVSENTDELLRVYLELKEYVEHYFDNLDVQEEIDNKLDVMATDGSLTNLIKTYVDPIYQVYEQSINNVVTTQNGRISAVENELTSIASGSPIPVSSTSDMTDTTRVYVNTTDGNWYYYNGNSWVAGGIYQSTGIADNSVGLRNLKDEVINDRYTHQLYNLLNPFECLYNKGFSNSDGSLIDNNNFWLFNEITIPAGKSLVILYSDDFYKDTGSLISGVYKIGLYQLDNSFIGNATTNRYINNTNEYPIKVRVQIQKQDTNFNDRFKIMCIITDLLNENLTFMSKNFVPYNFFNNNNLGLNIIENDLSIDMQKRIIGLPKIEYEIGTISSGTGYTAGSTNRIRSKIYILMKKGSSIKCDNSVRFSVLSYKEDYSEYLGSTGWVKNYVFNVDTFCRILIKYNNDANINDIESLVNLIVIKSFEDNVLNNITINSNENNYINYLGNKIELENKAYYEIQNFNTMYQDACNYENKLFIFNNQGQFKVRDLETGEVSSLFNLDSYDTIKPHCNAVFFGTEKYSNDDLFPILYVNAYNTESLPLGTLYAHRVIYDSVNKTYSTALIQTIRIGFTDNEIWTISGDSRPYGNFILDTDNNKLYAFTLRGNNTRFFKFDMPLLNDGSNVTLAQSDILDMFDLPFYPYIQGAMYSNNQIFVLSGNNGIQANTSYLHVVNLTSKESTNNLYLGSLMNEPEAIFYYKKLYIGEYNFYKFNL